MTDTPDILKKILAYKREEVAKCKREIPLTDIQQHLPEIDAPRDFVAAINKRFQQNKPAVIAEIKKASPSQGVIRPDFYPASIAESYEKAGAACLSVLTDRHFFQGCNDYLHQAKQHSSLPVLRKDFIIDAYQIYESRFIGADCILLIVAALTDDELQSFHDIASELGMSVLVESHSQQELERALKLPTPLIGINNRDLHTFNTDLQTSINLKKFIPNDRIAITESGINTFADISRLMENGIMTFLIGEAFMRARDPGEQLQQLLKRS